MQLAPRRDLSSVPSNSRRTESTVSSSGEVHPDERRRDDLLDIPDSPPDPEPGVSRGVAVAQLDRLVPALRLAARHARTAARAVREVEVNLDRRPSSGVEDLPAAERRNHDGHRSSTLPRIASVVAIAASVGSSRISSERITPRARSRTSSFVSSARMYSTFDFPSMRASSRQPSSRTVAGSVWIASEPTPAA